MKILDNCNLIHFIGILGSSMSNLALSTKRKGIFVTGSDKRCDEILTTLQQNDIHAYVGSNTQVVKNADLIVYSSAIPPSDIELSYARSLGKLCISRAEYLSLICKKFKKVIAVSGTHGKSTVTAMLGHLFSDAGLKPFVHVGAKFGHNELFDYNYAIIEACEYKQSFYSLSPDIELILNVEYDHPDCYDSLDSTYKSFNEFSKRIKKGGTLITLDNININVENKYSVPLNARYEDLSQSNGCFTFTPYVLGKRYPKLTLSIPGLHNVTNALFALLVSAIENIDPIIATKSLSTFKGVDRRFQRFNDINGGKIILDYAHHPTEIKTVISTAKLSSDYVVVYFQPHTYSRTAKLFDEFCYAFDQANEVIIVEEYPARENATMGKSALELANAISNHKKCSYKTLSDAKNHLLSTDNSNKTILILGAGNINDILVR